MSKITELDQIKKDIKDNANDAKKAHTELDKKVSLIEQEQTIFSDDMKDIKVSQDEIKDKMNAHQLDIKDVIFKVKEDIIEHVKETYTSKEKFSPVEMIVYGLVSTILTAVVATLLTVILI